MDRPIHRVNGREQVEQLYLGQGAMMVAGAIRRLLERVGVYDGRPMLHMDVRKKRYATVVRNEKYRQQPLYIFNHRFSHSRLSLFQARR